MPDHLSMSVSFKKSTNKSNLNHNNRKFTEKQKEKNNHINYDRTDSNKYFVQKDLKEIYEKEFGAALQKYNQKQKRKDRKIDSYYQHTKDSKKTALQQEMVIQVGDKDDFIIDEHWDLANEVLEDWFKGFEERNPNLKVYNAVIHNDETSPHLHLNFVPVASGYKRGLEKQVSFDRAIKQDDQTLDKKRPFADWREKEVDLIAERLQERGIERKIVGTNHYKDVNDYKKRKDLEREIKGLDKDLSMKKEELQILNKKSVTDNSLGIVPIKERKEVEVETEKKGLFGKPKMEKVERWTNRVIVENEDFERMNQAIEEGKKNEEKLNDLLDMNVYKENKDLKKFHKEDIKILEEKHDKASIDSFRRYQSLQNDYSDLNIDYHNSKAKIPKLEAKIFDLETETDDLKAEIFDLKRDFEFVYYTTRNFLKEGTKDIEAFKRTFKSWVGRIIKNIQNFAIKDNFRSRLEADLEELEPKKPELDIKEMEREAKERKQEEKKNNKTRKPPRRRL